MVENKFDWEEVIVDTKLRTHKKYARKIVLYPQNNSVAIGSDLVSDARWSENERGMVRLSLYRSGKMFMLKPNNAGSLDFRCNYIERNGKRVPNGRALRMTSLDMKLTLLGIAESNSKLAKKVIYDAWVDGNSIIFKYEESIYADESKAVNE